MAEDEEVCEILEDEASNFKTFRVQQLSKILKKKGFTSEERQTLEGKFSSPFVFPSFVFAIDVDCKIFPRNLLNYWCIRTPQAGDFYP